VSNNYKEVIVIDLEATCWETDAETALNTSEIIEIGVCVLDVQTGEIKKPQGLIIKPKKSKISPFCESLTSITQDMVDAGMSFEKSIKILKQDYGVSRRIMGAYGNYDQNMLLKECDRRHLKTPFGPTYLNISAMCALKLKATRRLSVEDALKGFGLQFEGRPHRGVDDAVQAARLLWEIIK
jgi:inhibitor of KinA sporulation pathway (predicted exonuclease)